MLVNVRVVLERMETAGIRHEEMFSVSADLLYRRDPDEMTRIGLQLMEAFVKGYKEICHAAVGGTAESDGSHEDGSGDRASGGTARSVLLHEDLGGGE